MIDISTDSKKIISTLKNMLYSKQEFICYDIICNSTSTIEYTYSQYAGQYSLDCFCLYLGVDIKYYTDVLSKYDIDYIKKVMIKELEVIFDGENQCIDSIVIKPLVKHYFNWNLIDEYDNKEAFISDILKLRDMLIDVSTGVKKIEQIEIEYKNLYNKVDEVFIKIDLDNPNPFKSLWEAYSYWSTNLDSYAKRRVYFSNLYYELLKLVNTSEGDNIINIQLEYTNWDSINRTIVDIKKQYNEANTAAQFNGIGAMCRNVYNCLADVIYKEEYHIDKTSPLPNANEYKNKLLEFVVFKLDGKTNEDFRSHCKKMIDIADTLTHKKTATKQQAALTINAVISILNIVTILNENSPSDSFDDLE